MGQGEASKNPHHNPFGQIPYVNTPVSSHSSSKLGCSNVSIQIMCELHMCMLIICSSERTNRAMLIGSLSNNDGDGYEIVT